MNRTPLLFPPLAALAGLVPALAWLTPTPAAAQAALFGAREVDETRFLLVAAPIGDGTRAQLNIYEQISDRRPCFATSGSTPARVDPLLGGFDFTGICTRYLDGNGYSLRVGNTDLGTVYRLSVVRQGSDNILLAAPSRNRPGPEMIVARTNGHAAGFLQLIPEPGWMLKRRHFGDRALGHVYLYRQEWPAGAIPEASPAELAVPPSIPTDPAGAPAAGEPAVTESTPTSALPVPLAPAGVGEATP